MAVTTRSRPVLCVRARRAAAFRLRPAPRRPSATRLRGAPISSTIAGSTAGELAERGRMTRDASLLLKRLNDGDPAAADELLPLIYRELHGMASRYMDGERLGHTLQPTALVNEAFLRLVGDGAPSYDGEAHFFNLAARAMRNVLVDHARQRAADKRGGDRQREPLDDALAAYRERGICVLAVHEALERLQELDEPLARVVELRFFAGLPLPRVAESLGVSLRTAERSWFSARAWLRRELDGGPELDG
jgi:RNA polymerase sigma factor (TIGR02999 family)